MTRTEIRATLTDEMAVAATLFGEAVGEPMAGQVAVGGVIRNRALAPRWWGRGYVGVCLAKAQFSCWWEANANTQRVYDVAEALVTHQPIGDRTMLAQLRWIAQGLIGEQLPDAAKGADHYLTTKLLTSPQCPTWARGQTPVTRIGAHSFFRLEL